MGHEDNPSETNTIFFKKRLPLIIVAAVLLILAVIFLVLRFKKPNLSVNDIRNLFPNETTTTPTPPAGGPTPTITLPSPSPSPTPPPISPTPTPPPAGGLNPTLPQEPQVFKSTLGGFEYTYTSIWQPQELSGNAVAFVSQKNQAISINFYPQGDATLELIKVQLTNSPSVRTVSSTTFKNLPALAFTTNQNQNGLALISNGRIYYIFGTEFLDPANLSFF